MDRDLDIEGPSEEGARRPRLGSRVPVAIRRAAVAGLLALFALQVLLMSRQMSPAFDEVARLPAGYLFLKTGLWHLLPEQPPFIAALSALPLLVLQPRLDATNPNWWYQRQAAWTFGSQFLYSNDADRLIFWGRVPVLLLALLLGYVVYRWASDLYGGDAGLLALVLYACCPTVVAHSGFTSHDLGVACFATLSVYWLWQFLREGTWHHLLWTSVLLGAALASKTVAVVLPPVFIALTLLAAWRPPRSGDQDDASSSPPASLTMPLAASARGDRVYLVLTALAVIVLVACGVLYTVYLFPSDPLFYVRSVLMAPELPVKQYRYYLMGEFRAEGWWHYFLAAFAFKTPVPTLLLLLLAIWTFGRDRRGWIDEAFLLLPALAVLGLMSALAHPIGVRYILPAYPFLFIFAGRTAVLFTRGRVGAVAALLLAAWYMFVPLRIYPDYLAYFNELVGGPRRGIEYLDDSNIDWGQNLKRLKRYLDARQFDRVKLLYFGMGRPEYYGIRATPIELRDLARPPEPGIYVISANALVRARAYFNIDWLTRYELLDVVGYSFYIFRV